jgi:hypothetical protein
VAYAMTRCSPSSWRLLRHPAVLVVAVVVVV